MAYYFTHHESHTRLHNIWCSINTRCRHHKRYAGRGIKKCEEWNDYENFAKWANENGYADNLTIERIDVDGPYSPENCKWIPIEEQARNRSTTHWVDFNGERISLAEACERLNMPYKLVHYRIRHGWSEERALHTPKFVKSDLHKKCDALGINYHTVYTRIKLGWSEESALNTEMLGIGANQTSYNRS